MAKFSRKLTARMPDLAISPPASGPNVVAWQYFLKQGGFYKSHRLTGAFDHETLFATQAFQRKNGLPSHGVVYQQTWDLAFLQGFATFDELTHDAQFHSVLTVADIHTASGVKRYSLKPGEHIRMPPSLEPILAKIAKDFFFATGETLVVTSGTRTAAEQAQAMKHNLETQGRQHMLGLYKEQDVLNEILNAYDSAEKTSEARLKAMTAAITAQMSRHVFISLHLTGGGIDLRWPGGGRQTPSGMKLRSMVEDRKHQIGDIYPIDEGDHLHIQLTGRH